MNNYKWIGDPNIRGWVNTDATRLANCPKCGSNAGFHCETPKGLKAKAPHTERVKSLSFQSV